MNEESLSIVFDRNWVGDEEFEKTKLEIINQPTFMEINTPIRMPKKEDFLEEPNNPIMEDKYIKELLFKIITLENRIQILENKIDLIINLIQNKNK